MVQLVRSSESIEPRRPKRAPEAPTEIPLLINNEDNMLPPIPDITYMTPILTGKTEPQKISRSIIKLENRLV